MTGFTRRFLRWWTTRRRIGAGLATEVERYIDDRYVDEDATGSFSASMPLEAPGEGCGACLTMEDAAPTAWDAAPSAPCMATPAAAAAPRRNKAAARQTYGAAPPSLESLLRNLDASFSDTLFQMIDARGLSDSQVYRHAHLSRQHFSKIRSNPAYRPTKSTVLALAIALGLTLEETRLLLERAGFSLSHASKADIIVEYFIEHGERDLNVINRTLYHFDQPILGS